MKKKVILWFAAIIVAVGAAFIVWKVQDTNAKAARLESEILKGLTTEEIVMILENQALVEPSTTSSVVQTPESRKAFLNGLREYMALAARARREGMADDPNIKLSVEFKKNILLQSLYTNKLDNETGAFYEVPNDHIEAFMRDPENENRFNTDMAAFTSIQKSVVENSGNPYAAPQFQGEAIAKARKHWAKTKILSGMALEDLEFVQQPAVQLRLKVVEAGVLASNYLNKHWSQKVKVTDAEVAAYLGAHPEYDLKKKRETAEIVLRRAKAGEDFAKLANEFSEDRSTRRTSGLYEDAADGVLWPEVQKAALGMEKGQIADALIETKDGFHIVQLVEKKTTKEENGTESVKLSIKHILLQRRFEEPNNSNPNVPPPFMTPIEIAQAEVQKDKRKRFIDEIVRSENITLPDDFEFVLTDQQKAGASQFENLMQANKLKEKPADK
mgnify:CR=1 FL=1